MLSKEEILGRPEFLPRDNVPDYLRTMYDPKKVLAAMDEYAKQEAIGFGEFLLNRVNESCAVRDKDDILVWEGDNCKCLTTNELYQQYLNSKTNATK